jgi:uroporphyrinogen-III synthase
VADAAKSPLEGKRVVVTRAIEQTSDLNARLTAHGAIPISLPLVSFAPPADYAPLDASLRQLHSFDWIIFTSANAVHAVASRAAHKRVSLEQKSSANQNRPQIAVVGPATKSEAAAAGLPADYIAKTHLGIALAEELADRLRNKSVFLPRSDRANPDLPAALRKLGAKLTEVIAYRTIPPDSTNCARVNAVIDGEADAILFFSPSAVQNFNALTGRERLSTLQNRIAIVAVGPITARALTESGAHKICIATDTTTAAVVDALANHFASSSTRAAATSSQAGANRT